MADAFERSLRDRFDPTREAGKDDPVVWLRDRLDEFAWSKQREIMRSVQDHQRTAVPSCHGPGKSHIASRVICRFIDIHEPGTAFVVTTAPRAHQVRAILWRYIRRAHKKAGLPGVILQGQIPEWKIDGELVGFGRKPADMDADTLQGLHEYRLLIVFDEACGIGADLYTAAESLMTNDGCHWLCIGNPDDNSSFFHKICTTEPGWNVIPISAMDTPAITGEEVPPEVADRLVSKKWIDDKKLRWGETSPLYQSKVLGQWVDAPDGLIPLSWARSAVARWHAYQDRLDRLTGHEPPGRRVIGVDPAWLGQDMTAIVVRQGPVILSAKTYAKLDTQQVASLVAAELRTRDAVAVVDVIGVGAGVVDALRAAGQNVIAFNGSAGTRRRDHTGTWRFPNCRSAAWYNLREVLDPIHGGVLCLPDNDELIADITTPTYGPAAGGMLKVEPKDAVKARIGRSPDLGDALCYSLWTDPPGKRVSTADPIGDDELGPQVFAYRTHPDTMTIGQWQPAGYGSTQPWAQPRWS